jgi:asparagine synthase (glutamine-hydrolysing)
MWLDGSIGLGNRLLHETPESLHESLPAKAVASASVITSDCRIDNRTELMDELGLHENGSGGIPDSTLILRAYERWGEDSPNHIMGDFAFAVWDAARQQLFIARDPFGVRPLYYYSSDRLFVFGSEIKSLLRCSAVPRRRNELMIAKLLVMTFHENKASTFYADIHRLPPAYTLTVNRSRVRLQQYWELNPDYELRLRSAEYAEGVRALFKSAIEARLRSVRRVGSLLSGGLDSSSIACTARQIAAKDGTLPVPTFSAIFPSIVPADSRIDERRYMDAVLNQGGFEAHFVYADQVNPLDGVNWQDEPIAAPLLFMDWAIFREAHRRGIPTLMSGFDGDSTVSYGYEYLGIMARTGRWRKLRREIRTLSERHGFPTSWYVQEFVRGEFIPDWAREVRRRLRRMPPPPAWDPSVPINPEFAKRVGLAEEVAANQRPKFRNCHEEHIASVTSGLLVSGVELLNHCAAVHQIGLALPFFDRKLVEFCVAIPAREKLADGWTRAVMRRAMHGILPPEVETRAKKANLSAAFALKLIDYAGGTLQEVFSNTELISEYVDVAAIKSAYSRYLSAPLRYPHDSFNVFIATTLSLWLRRVLA